MAITKQRKSKKNRKKMANKKKVHEPKVEQRLGFPDNFFRIFGLTRVEK